MSGSQATPTDATINVSSSNRQSSPQPMEAKRIDTDVASHSVPIAASGVQREGPSDQSKLLVPPMHSGTSWIRAEQSGTHDVSSDDGSCYVVPSGNNALNGGFGKRTESATPSSSVSSAFLATSDRSISGSRLVLQRRLLRHLRIS